MAIQAGVLKMLAEDGRLGKIVSTARLDELGEEFDSKRRLGLIDEELYRTYLSGLTFRPPENLPQARSIIVVASPDPQIRFSFAWKDSILQATVPPTYLHGREIDAIIEKTLTQSLRPEGHQVVAAFVPKKLLAVRSGLALYGRNNITYVKGMGSFHRLTAFFSSLPCRRDDWRAPEMLARCERCAACRKACPSGAIAEDRFLLRAERCIVFHNEKPSAVPFPDWMHPSWHNSVVGCMLCQQVCPENREVLDFTREETTFTESETGLLLKGVPAEKLPAETAEKLRSSDLVELLDVLPRNLQALLDRSSRRGDMEPRPGSRSPNL
jgi:epoxyqueuosine reductase